MEDKGLDYLLDAFARHPDPGARLVIGGDHVDVAGGSVMGRLRARIAADPRISTVGLLRGHELDDFFASIDTFLLPSVAESFGIAQAEAIMLGIASITTDIPGGRYPVAVTGLGTLIAPRDVDGLAAAMLRPHDLDDDARAAAAAWARDEFGLERFLDRHLSVLGLAPSDPDTRQPKRAPSPATSLR